MQRKVSIEIINEQFSVCVDCLMYLANGDAGENCETCNDEIEHEYLKLIRDGMDVFITDDEGSFGSLPCNLCGSHLGGNRFDTTLVEIKS